MVTEASCPRCGNHPGGGARFCGQCGYQVPAAAPGPAASYGQPAAQPPPSNSRRTQLILLVVAVLVLVGGGVAAAVAIFSGSDDDTITGTPPSSSPTSSAPESSSATTSTSAPVPVGAFSTLSGQATTIVPAAAFVAALSALRVVPGLSGTAEQSAEGFAFPITGGYLKIYKKGAVTPFVQGKIEHDGSGLTLNAGSTTITLQNFVIDPGDNPKITGDVLANGKSVTQGVKLFDLDIATLRTPTVAGGVATLAGTTIYLSNEGARLLNTSFRIDAFKGGARTGTMVGNLIVRAAG